MNLNKVFVLGRLTADPQLRTTPSGQSVSSFSIATNRVWTDKSGVKQEEVEYHNIVIWARQAEIASQYLTKGSMVLIEGRLKTRVWQDKAGQQRRTTEIISERMQLGPRQQGLNKQPSATGGATGEPTPKADTGEEIPTVDVDESGEAGDKNIPF